MGNGVEISDSRKVLEESLSKLTFTNASTVSDYDVEGYDRIVEETQCIVTFASIMIRPSCLRWSNPSQYLRRSAHPEFGRWWTMSLWRLAPAFWKWRVCTIHIWRLFKQLVFLKEMDISLLDNLPLSTKKLVTPPITTSMKFWFNESGIMHRLLEGRWCEQDLYLRVCSANLVWGSELKARFLCFAEAFACLERFQARCKCNAICW